MEFVLTFMVVYAYCAARDVHGFNYGRINAILPTTGYRR